VVNILDRLATGIESRNLSTVELATMELQFALLRHAAATWEPQSTMIVECNAGRAIERGPMF
jgi:hypothetical protein